MKSFNNKLILIVLYCLPGLIFSQVAIGKTSIDGAGILDFAAGDRKGIILPWTNSIANPVNGMFTFDLSTNKVMFYGNNQWNSMTFSGIAPSVINNDPETADKGVIIGATNSTAKGVLILESNSKALILPKVNNVSTDIVNPSPGTICYDLSTNSMALFNGVSWSYWK